ncbi:MAG: hypothetical protein ACW99Q_03290 [Candidatus Kariarchaeaceae archaeon]|jgi:hypothetical protein
MYLGSVNLAEHSITVLHEAGVITEDQQIIRLLLIIFSSSTMRLENKALWFDFNYPFIHTELKYLPK